MEPPIQAGFADLCLTTWRPRLCFTKQDEITKIPETARIFLSRACGGSRFYRRIRDWSTDQIAPFGPRTVVIAHIFEPEQILQHEPGVRTALANAAIGDDFVSAVNSLFPVELL